MLQNAHTQYYQFTMIVRHLIEIEWRMMGKTNRIFFSHSARAHGTTNSLFFFLCSIIQLYEESLDIFLLHTHTHTVYGCIIKISSDLTSPYSHTHNFFFLNHWTLFRLYNKTFQKKKKYSLA